jgi:hypothetical protein
MGRFANGNFVHFSAGYECFDDGFFAERIDDVCDGPIDNPIEEILVSSNLSEWKSLMFPTDEVIGVGYRGFTAGVLLLEQVDSNWDPVRWWATSDGHEWFVPTLDGSLLTRKIMPFDWRRFSSDGVVMFTSSDEGDFAVSNDDGHTFTSVTPHLEFASGMVSIFAIDGGLGALVWPSTATGDEPAVDAPTLWYSTNGIDWSKRSNVTGLEQIATPLAASFQGSGRGVVEKHADVLGLLSEPPRIGQLADGRLIAIGSRFMPSPIWQERIEAGGYVAISDDGSDWTEVEPLPSMRGLVADSIRFEAGWVVAQIEECYSDRMSCDLTTFGSNNGVEWASFFVSGDPYPDVSTRGWGISINGRERQLIAVPSP